MKKITHFFVFNLLLVLNNQSYSQNGVCIEITNPVYETNKQSLAIENPIFGGLSTNSLYWCFS